MKAVWQSSNAVYWKGGDTSYINQHHIYTYCCLQVYTTQHTKHSKPQKKIDKFPLSIIFNPLHEDQFTLSMAQTFILQTK